MEESMANACSRCGKSRPANVYLGRPLCGDCVDDLDAARAAAAASGAAFDFEGFLHRESPVERRASAPAAKLRLPLRQRLLGALAWMAGCGACLAAVITAIVGVSERASGSTAVAFRLGAAAGLFIAGSQLLRWGNSRRYWFSGTEHAVEFLLDTDVAKRNAAMAVLRHVAWTPHSEHERASWLVAQGRWTDIVDSGPDTTSVLLTAMTWPHCTTAVLRALARVGHPSGAGPLIEFLSSSKSEFYRNEVVRTLRSVTGADPGATARDWVSWLERQAPSAGRNPDAQSSV
jgi:hypothetical protein